MDNNILQELRRPFHPSAIEWKPQATTKAGDKAMAAAYADPRAYMNRLDEVCGMDWAVTFTPWDERIICHVTIQGITRSSTGEPDKQSEKSEIAGTAAEAQSFKRACAMFGVGRYLYEFEPAWVEYDAESKKFTAAGKVKLDRIIMQHYQRHINATPTPAERQPAAILTGQAAAPANGAAPEPPPQNEQEPPQETNPFHDPNLGVEAQKRQQQESMVEKAAHWRQLDNKDEPCSEKQYGYFVSVVERITGKDTHPKAFYAMFKRQIDGENRPGKKAVQWLFDALPAQVAQVDDNNKPVKNDAGKNIYIPNPKQDAVAVEAVKELYRRITV